MKQIALLVVLIMLETVGANGAVRYVSSVSGADTGGGTNAAEPCATIQYAVDQSNSGDEIHIATYDVEIVVLPPSVTTNTCVYTGTGASVIELAGGKSLILKGGYMCMRTEAAWQQGIIPPVVDGQDARRGLYAVGGDNDTNRIELIEFANGAADNGANVYAEGGSLQLVGTPIHNGVATEGGGGVYMSGVDFSVSMGSYSNLALPQMTGFLPIYSNSAAHGGGLYLDGGYPLMTTVGVMDNTATANGGGVYINGGFPSVIGGIIRDNRAGDYGGGIYLINSVARVGGMIITGNRADYGGGIYLDGPFAFSMETATLIANNYIQDNVATAGKGGAIYFNAANVGVVNNVLTGNDATNGAAAYLYASSPRFLENTIADNTGDTGLYVTNDEAEGRWIVTPEIVNPYPPYNVIVPAGSNYIAGIPVPSWPTLTNTIISGHATALHVDSSGNELLENEVDMGFTLWWSNTTDIAGAGTVNHDDDLYGNPLYTSTGTAPDDLMPYHIETNSPAVDTGTEVALTLPGTDLLLDIDAQLRPSGEGMDIGADEVVTDPFSVWFVPAAIARTVQPDQIVTNEHMLLNSGTQNDTYDIAVSNNLWSGGVTPMLVSLDAQSYTSVIVVITVPADAVDGETNTTVVTAISQADSNRMALAVDTTGISTNTGGDAVRYVWQNSPNPGAPFTTPDTAGHDIQTVVNVCVDGDTVLVYPGAYDAGGAVTPGFSLTNRVCITNAITLTSLSGQESTHILGAADPVATNNGPAAIRCLYANTNATISGFTLMDGHTMATGSDWQNLTGGGACLDGAGIISNCTIVGCFANDGGGGLYSTSAGEVRNTRIRSCFSENHGGGAYLINGGKLNNGLVYENAAAANGGGIYAKLGGQVYSCTVVSNSAADGGGIYVEYDANIINDIIYFNSAPTNANIAPWAAAAPSYCCTIPHPGGSGHITSNPQFVDAGADDYHLQGSSPCIDSGTENYATSHDLDGNPRPLDGDAAGPAVVDIGCYEVYNENGDSDGDSATDGDEVIADTDPMDETSYLHITAISNPVPLMVYFESSAARLYSLQGRESLVTGQWSRVEGATNHTGAGGADSLDDTNQPPQGPFYRLEVELP
jgi:hypothetical protein